MPLLTGFEASVWPWNTVKAAIASLKWTKARSGAARFGSLCSTSVALFGIYQVTDILLKFTIYW
jgi:hypothetical protein